MITVPAWVPSPVQTEIKKWLAEGAHNYRDHPEDLAILRRLATDERMKRVWNVLGGDPVALKGFFFVACDARCHPRLLVTADGLDDEATNFSIAADRSRWIDTQTAKKQGDIARAMWARSRRLGADPPVIRRDLFRPPLIVVKERTTSDPIRAYVLELSSLTCKFFGSRLLTTVATTASVAWQQRVTSGQVRRWTDAAEPSASW